MNSNTMSIVAQMSIVELAITSAKTKDPVFSQSWLLERYRAISQKMYRWIAIEGMIPPKQLVEEFEKMCKAICAFADKVNDVTSWNDFEEINFLTESTWDGGKAMEFLSFMGKAGVITLCGSTRFHESFIAANMLLTKRGWTVLSCGSFGHSYHKEIVGEDVSPTVKALHFFKILQSDAICVIQPSQHIGKSTALEIEFAKKHDRTIVKFESTGKHTGHFVLASKNFGFTAKQSTRYATLYEFLGGEEWLDFILEHRDFY